MKKLLIFILVCLGLAGCSAQEPAAVLSSDPAQEQTQPVITVSLYDPDHPAEQASDGAVRAYALGDGEYRGLLRLNEGVVVISGEGDATVLDGPEGNVLHTAALHLGENWSAEELSGDGQRLVYYARQSREVVILDETLQQIQRITMPSDMEGTPVVHPDLSEIFYCAGQQIRSLSIQTGISRLVRSHSCLTQELTGSYFDGSVLGCRITDEAGAQKIVYLYAQTGQVINQDTTMGVLQTYGQDYFALRTTGQLRQYLFGSADGETMCLNVAGQQVSAALALNGAVEYREEEAGLALSFYDFSTGKRTAAVTIAQASAPQAILCDESAIWLLSGKTLYRWDVSASPVTDSECYTGPLYTAENPDTAGLELCRTKADAIQQQYGITLRLWQEVADVTPGVEREYQVRMISDALNAIEAVLQKLPEGFLERTGDLEVDLVRSVEGYDAYHYRTGKTCCVMIPCQQAEQYFLWGLGWAVDTRTLGNSRDYDFWDDLNPEGFAYDYDYKINAARQDAQAYLEGERVAFADQVSMSFPSEDRARVFAAAVMAGNDALFASEIMQAKLVMLCGAIREAYYLDDSTEVLPWEQYLEVPLAKEE